MVDTGLCKKTKIRFEKFMPMVNPEQAAAAIISAQRKGLEEASIPRYLFHANNFFRLFPKASMTMIRNFTDAFIESDL